MAVAQIAGIPGSPRSMPGMFVPGQPFIKAVVVAGLLGSSNLANNESANMGANGIQPYVYH